MQGQSSVAIRYEVVQDRKQSSDWRVEGLDVKSGDVNVTLFSGSQARERAEEYAKFKNA
jgi:hypothetical protein